jgi:hypothetical protein
MGSVAAIALATPALALPDRYEQGYNCSGALCPQQQFREDGNRFDEKANDAAINDENGSGASNQAATRDNDGDDNFGDEAGDAVENTADEAGDEISEAADEAGDAIDNAADEAGDELDEAGDAIDDAF